MIQHLMKAYKPRVSQRQKIMRLQKGVTKCKNHKATKQREELRNIALKLYKEQ